MSTYGMKCKLCGKKTYGRQLCGKCYGKQLKRKPSESDKTFVCTRCLEEKPIDDFKALKNSKTLLRSVCLSCRSRLKNGLLPDFNLRLVSFPLELTSRNCPLDGFDHQIDEEAILSMMLETV